MWPLTVARQKTYGMLSFCRIIPKESDSVPVRNQDTVSSGGKSTRKGSEEPCKASWSSTDTSERLRFQHGTRSLNLGSRHISKELLRVLSSPCKGSSPGLHLPLPASVCKNSHCPSYLLVLWGYRARRRHKISETQTTSPPDYFTYLIEPTALPSLFFSTCFPFLAADPYKVKKPQKHHLGRQETTKTALSTWRASRPWPTQGQLRLWSERRAAPAAAAAHTVFRHWTSAKRTLLSFVCVARPAVQLMVSEVVLETGTSSRCRSWRLGPATAERKRAAYPQPRERTSQLLQLIRPMHWIHLFPAFCKLSWILLLAMQKQKENSFRASRKDLLQR